MWGGVRGSACVCGDVGVCVSLFCFCLFIYLFIYFFFLRRRIFVFKLSYAFLYTKLHFADFFFLGHPGMDF